MNKRLPQNKNLTLLDQDNFNGLPVQSKYKPFVSNYLESIEQVIQKALSEHPRSCVIRVELRLPKRINCPDQPQEYDSKVISRFMDSLKAQIRANLYKRQKEDKRVHPSTVRHVWAKEKNESINDHYHVALFFNNDTYRGLGNVYFDDGNMAARIKKAWASALGVELFEVEGLVYFPKSCVYQVDANSPSFLKKNSNLFERLSYLAKSETKNYGDRSNAFGCSRK